MAAPQLPDQAHGWLCSQANLSVRLNGVAQMSRGWIISGSAEILHCPRCANDRAPARETRL